MSAQDDVAHRGLLATFWTRSLAAVVNVNSTRFRMGSGSAAICWNWLYSSTRFFRIDLLGGVGDHLVHLGVVIAPLVREGDPRFKPSLEPGSWSRSQGRCGRRGRLIARSKSWVVYTASM